MTVDPIAHGTAALLLDGHPLPSTLLGEKGASLNRLIATTVPVPASGVVTTAAYHELARSPTIEHLTQRIRTGERIAAEEVDETFGAVAFRDESAATIVEAARRVAGSARLAVRSSATVEDLAGSSFAGQYRSMLDIDPSNADELLAAVRLVFASLWHPAPRAYRAALGIDESAIAMAAVVMRMVPADRAGVVFTQDPGGAPNTARVEAVEGLGESLVSGQRTPSAWLVPHDLAEFDGPDEIATAVVHALKIEQQEGVAQDIEWAFDGQTVWIVQARPITVAADRSGDGFDDPPAVAELTTAGIDEMLPGVLPPLRWQLVSHLVNEAFRRLVADLGAGSGGERRFVRRVRGRAAMDFDSLRELARRLPGGSAEELETQYLGSQRPGRPAAPAESDASRWSTLRHDLRSLGVRRRSSLEAEIVIHAVDAMDSRPDLEGLDPTALAAYQFRLIDLAVRATAAELAVASSATSSYRKIELLVAPHLGDVEAGRWAERVTSAHGLAVAPHPDASAAVFCGPTWTELGRETVTEGELRAGVPDDSSDPEAALFEQLRSSPSWGDSGIRPAVRTRALRHVITEAVALLHRREATKAALLRLGGEVRRTALEQGRRLTERGVLDRPSDVELLTMEEIRSALDGQRLAPNTLAQRRRWRHRYESEPPLPRVFVGIPDHEPVQLPRGGRLDGWAASPGRFTGRATVVADAAGQLESGAILVATATDASWSPLFLRAGAIVVDRGGPLSHAAILARELGVPAVLNVQGASQMLDGMLVTVDGDAGIVVVHDGADGEPTETAGVGPPR